MPTCILMEKPSAFKHMIQAINYKDKPSQRPSGDRAVKVNSMEAKATFNGKHYLVTHSFGCLLGYTDPTKMIKKEALAKNPKLKEQLGSWAADAPFWNPKVLDWKQKTLPGKANALREISHIANQCKAFIIAGDSDATGAGDQLQCDILHAIHWNWSQNPVYRIRFDDDSILPDLRKALTNGIKSMTDTANQRIVEKATGRGHWDYIAGLQETRKATALARQNGYHVSVVNEGRLKSVMMNLILNRWRAHNNYVKKPYWEVQFQDENGHNYSRSASYKSHPKFRFTSQDKAKQDLAKYHNSKPSNIKTSTKTQSPGLLLNLASLSALMNKRGYSPMEVQNTYQQLYEHGYVSYPRTDDKKITLAQFQAMGKIVDNLADVVGVDKKLLTHRQPRKKFLTKKADHGANRVMKVPSSLGSLAKYGKSATSIYKTLAKNDLAMFCEDYVYKHTTAQLADYPKFTTSYNVPEKLNWKLVFDNGPKKKGNNVKPLGQVDKPYLHQGTNPRTSKPNTTWLFRMLGKYNVGTGATRNSTLAQISSGKNKKINVKRGALTLTNSGIICAEMAQNTMIGNVKVTAQLFALMDDIRKGKPGVNVSTIEDTATMVVKHDKPIFAQNAKNLSAKKGKGRETFPVDVDGQTKQVNRNFMSHRFTDDEIQKLKAHQKVEIGPFKSKGSEFDVLGHLDWNQFKNKGKVIKFYGFKLDKFIPKNQKEKVGQGKMKFNRTFAGHRFTDDEVKALQAGKSITCTFKSSKGKPFKATGKLAHQSFKNGKKTIQFYGFKITNFVMSAKQKAYQKERASRPSATVKGKTGKFKPVFAGHKMTPDEIKALQAGKSVSAKFKSRKGKTFTANVKLKWSSFRGHKYLGYDMSFNN